MCSPMSRRRIEFDIVAAGAGPAGIAAACIAAESGLRTAVLDATPWLGGQIWRSHETRRPPKAARRWIERLGASGTQVLRRTSVIDAPRPHELLAETPDGAAEIAWDKLVLAVGARELFLPFPGWTLPGVVGVGGLQVMVKAGWPLAGKRVVVAGSGPLLFAAAAEFRSAGADVVLMAEQADLPGLLRFGAALPRFAPKKLVQAAGYQMRLLGVRYRTGCWPVAAQGDGRLESVDLRAGRRTLTVPCDVLACGFGFTPNLELPKLLGCRIENNEVKVNLWQETSVPGVYCAGEPTGIGGEDRALIEGKIAGCAAAGLPRRAERLFKARDRARKFSRTMERGFALREDVKRLARPETIVCRCEDVTRGELEKWGDWRSAKLQTRCGMGPCQGRICGGAARAIYGWEPESARPPVFPIDVATLMEAGTDPGAGDAETGR